MEPANRSNRKGGGKEYTHPVTGEVFVSVTTVLEVLEKEALKQWSANLATDFAIDNMPMIMESMLVPECKNTNNRCHLKHGRENRCERCPCGKCTPCWARRAKYRHTYESKRRSEEGTECHAAIDHWVLTGGGLITLRPEVQPYFDTFLQFVEDYGLQPTSEGQGSWLQTEITLLNREHGFAGTSDGVLEFVRGRAAAADLILDRLGKDRAAIRVDYKTREKPEEALYDEMPLQGVAYDRCPLVMTPDGAEYEADRTDACALLQIRPELNYTFKLMVTDDQTYAAFLHALGLFRWLDGPAKLAFDQDKSFPIQSRDTIVVARFQELFPDATLIEDPWAAESSAPVPSAVPPTPIDDPWAAERSNDAPPWPTDAEVAETKARNSTASPAAAAPKKRAPAAKKTARSATSKVDPFELAKTGNAILDSLATFQPGRPQSELLQEPIPF